MKDHKTQEDWGRYPLVPNCYHTTLDLTRPADLREHLLPSLSYEGILLELINSEEAKSFADLDGILGQARIRAQKDYRENISLYKEVLWNEYQERLFPLEEYPYKWRLDCKGRASMEVRILPLDEKEKLVSYPTFLEIVREYDKFPRWNSLEVYSGDSE